VGCLWLGRNVRVVSDRPLVVSDRRFLGGLRSTNALSGGTFRPLLFRRVGARAGETGTKESS
jgi:hypothetical protein